jgi:adenylate cyclase
MPASAGGRPLLDLPCPSGREAFVLARVGASADPAVRLACQLRPQSDVSVIPIVQPNVGAGFVRMTRFRCV